MWYIVWKKINESIDVMFERNLIILLDVVILIHIVITSRINIYVDRVDRIIILAVPNTNILVLFNIWSKDNQSYKGNYNSYYR